MLICEALSAADLCPTRSPPRPDASKLRAYHGTDLVVRDLSMPGMNGHEVLAAIKADDALRNIPVVMFTTSAAPRRAR